MFLSHSVALASPLRDSKSSPDSLQATCESAKTCRDPCKPFANPPKFVGKNASHLQIRQHSSGRLQAHCISSRFISAILQAPCEASRLLYGVCKPLARPPTILGTSSDIDFKEPSRKVSQFFINSCNLTKKFVLFHLFLYDFCSQGCRIRRNLCNFAACFVRDTNLLLNFP